MAEHAAAVPPQDARDDAATADVQLRAFEDRQDPKTAPANIPGAGTHARAVDEARFADGGDQITVQRRDATPAAPTDADRLTAVQGVLATTPSGRATAADLAASGASVRFEPGGGYFYDQENNSIVLGRDLDPRDQAAQLAHETEHARSKQAGESPHVLTAPTREAYVDGMLREEARANVAQIKVANELGRGAPFQAEYNEAYRKAFNESIAAGATDRAAQSAAEAAAARRVYEGYKNGEARTSVDQKPYPDYYGDYFDLVRGKPN